MGVFAVQATDNFSFKIFENSDSQKASIWSTPEEVPEKIIEEKNIKYILLTGKWGGNHDAPDLTDTIILVGLNSEEETISMLSIPRDLYVEYPGTDDVGKINEVYFHGLQRGEKRAMEELMGKVTEITGKPVESYVNLDFQGFIEIVDALWWVEVTLENNFVDYNYPDGNYGYKTFILKKWTWTLDGEVALMYARSRYSTSDFDRSLRQQEIISSIKDQVSELWYLKNIKKITELYWIINEYLETNLALSEIIEMALDLKSWDDSKILSFNLNDSCFYEIEDCEKWGFLYTPLRQYFEGKSVIIPNGATYYDLSVYDEIQDFSDIIFETPEAFSTPYNITIYNASDTPGIANDTYNILRPYGILTEENTKLENLTEKKFEKSILYYNELEIDDAILQLLEKVLDIQTQQIDAPLYSGTGTQIEIILTGTWSLWENTFY